MRKNIWFDMDGTLADLYNVEGWKPKLHSADPSPYAEAEPMHDMEKLESLLNCAKAKGYTINIVSWLCRGADESYDEIVKATKIEWLNEYLPNVEFDEILIVKYGTPKHEITNGGILFDDEERNRNEWKGQAYSEKEIMRVLKALS